MSKEGVISARESERHYLLVVNKADGPKSKLSTMTQEVLDNGKDKSKRGAKGEEKIPQLNIASVEKINKGMTGGEK